MSNQSLSDTYILKYVPTTRYQGSKRTILPWLYNNVKDMEFKTVLDGFGGTGSVSFLFKMMGKKVTFNDVLASNYMTGIALIENQQIDLSDEDVDFILHENGFVYPDFIQKTFKGVYYLPSENKLLDIACHNIRMLSEKYDGDELRIKQAIAYYALFQACLCKRPFNLFHRKNLYIRTAKTDRSFGNKTTWNTSFKTLFKRFSDEVSQKCIKTPVKHDALCSDIMNLRRKKFDLVYLDPPYVREHEKRPNDYYAMYHFFEGMLDYDNWNNNINWETKNLRLKKADNAWGNGNLEENFEKLFKKFQDSIIVFSYGDPGNPSVGRLKSLMAKYKDKVKVVKRQYNYKLNHKNGGLYEVLIIGE